MRIVERASLAAGERDPLIDLWVVAWRDAMPAIDFEARRAWFSARIDAQLGAGAVLLAARSDPPDETVLGYAIVDLGQGYLDQVVVDPRHQGRGVGSALIAAAKARAPAGLELHVNQDNPRAASLYERHGFGIVGQGTNPHSGLPIWHMAWRPG